MEYFGPTYPRRDRFCVYAHGEQWQQLSERRLVGVEHRNCPMFFARTSPQQHLSRTLLKVNSIINIRIASWYHAPITPPMSLNANSQVLLLSHSVLLNRMPFSPHTSISASRPFLSLSPRQTLFCSSPIPPRILPDLFSRSR